jgi:hypothetical protein
MMLEKTMPVMKSTLSFLRNLSAACLATSGLLLVVGDDDFGRQAAELAVELLDRKVEAVADIDTEPGARSGERGYEADLDPVGGVDGTGQHQGGGESGQAKRHRNLRKRSQRGKL